MWRAKQGLLPTEPCWWLSSEDRCENEEHHGEDPTASPVTGPALAAATSAAAVALLVGCADQQTRPLTTWHPKGDQARWIDSLSVTIFVIAGVVGVLVMAIIGYVLVRFRRRPDDVDGVDEPKQIEGHNAAQLDDRSVRASRRACGVQHRHDPQSRQVSKDALKVEVVGNQLVVGIPLPPRRPTAILRSSP